jgi:hypothetical protein
MKAAILIFTICFYWGMSTRLHFSTNETLSPTFRDVKTMGVLGVIYNHIPMKNPQLKERLLTKWQATKKKVKQYKWLMGLVGFAGFWQLIKWRKKVLKLQTKRSDASNQAGCLKVTCLVLGGAALIGYVVGLLFPTTVGFVAYMIGLGVISIFAIIFSSKLK